MGGVQQKQQQYKQQLGKSDGQVPKVEGLLPVEFSVVFEAFYWMQAKFVTISDSLFRRSDGGEEGRAHQLKLFLTFCNSRRGFTQKPGGTSKGVSFGPTGEFYINWSLNGELTNRKTAHKFSKVKAGKWDTKCFFRDTSKLLLTFSEVNEVSTIVKLHDTLEGQKRQRWVFQRSAT